MTISFYDASVGNYLQILGALNGVLDKGQKQCAEKGIDPESIVETRLAPDMLPFRFQVHSVRHHSRNAIEAMRSGKFGPPTDLPQDNYKQLQAVVTDTQNWLKALPPDEVNALEKNDVVFEIRGMKMPFTASDFLLSFSLPNFYFHATTAYDILRSKGVPLGKRDFMGQLRMKAA